VGLLLAACRIQTRAVVGLAKADSFMFTTRAAYGVSERTSVASGQMSLCGRAASV
jgi:hypothetical protein